ncbi:polyprenyl synthetase family protein [Devriesea agamarum]|uniref:polyprenyl synthetase family protein n=1 Tax=Devriesea agamarum TaxID=472569 RepID=UPI00071DB8E7|nr:polyprenyl synthetase family protein [Devriesea agamarum]
MHSLLVSLPDLDQGLAGFLSERLDRVEERLRQSVHTSDSLTRWTSTYLMEAGGKRVRPVLTLLAAAFGDGMRAEVLDAAVAVELTHLASLYHDDVMDSAPTRRGRTSAHEVWGNSVAILTGDFLFARASRISAGLGPEAVRIQAETFERLCIGQLHETVGPADDDDPYAHYLRVLSDKTASLIATAGRFGAMFSGCDATVVNALEEYGEKAGVAFQLVDDVIDLRSDGARTGKTPGTDLREGIPTMPSLLVRARYAAGDRNPETVAVVEALDSDLSDDEHLAQAVALLREDPATDETEKLATSWANDALKALRNVPDRPARAGLEAFTEQLVNRSA